MERNHMRNSHRSHFQHNNTTARNQYSRHMLHQHPTNAPVYHTQNHPLLIPSSNWVPRYVSAYVSHQRASYGHDMSFNWKPVAVSHGNNIYRGYQPIRTQQMQPSQQYIPPAPSTSYGYRRQVQSSSSMVTTNQERIRLSARYLYIDELLNHQNIQLEDGVMVLPTSPFDTENMWLTNEAFTNSTAPATVDVPDETIEANLNIKINTSSNAASSSDEEHEICVICQDEYENMEKIGALRCGHDYHVECIKKWLRKKNVCPICKATPLPLQS